MLGIQTYTRNVSVYVTPLSRPPPVRVVWPCSGRWSDFGCGSIRKQTQLQPWRSWKDYFKDHLKTRRKNTQISSMVLIHWKNGARSVNLATVLLELFSRWQTHVWLFVWCVCSLHRELICRLNDRPMILGLRSPLMYISTNWCAERHVSEHVHVRPSGVYRHIHVHAYSMWYAGYPVPICSHGCTRVSLYTNKEEMVMLWPV